MEKAKCPYCRSTIEIKVPPHNDHTAETNLCSRCHKPIAVYSCHANMMQHSDRSVKAIAVEVASTLSQDPLFEIVENQFTQAQELLIPEGTSILGRYNKDTSADLRVFTADPSMSRNHLKVVRKGNYISVSDYESNTGTFVNACMLAKGEQVRLSDGDVLSLGALSIIVHLPGEL